MHERAHETAPVRAAHAAGVAPARPPARELRLLRLQRALGNAYVGRLVQRSGGGESGGEVGSEIAGRIDRARSGGAGLDAGVRGQMEGAFGADFGGVRVHTGGEAHELNAALGARAFTTGRDVFFANGEYAPASSAGRELIAHELAHVVQQGGDAGPPAGNLVVGPADDVYEREADAAARAAVSGESASGGSRVSRAVVQRQETSNPPDMEEQLRRLGVQAKLRSGSGVIQRRGGATVGTLSVASNVVSAGLTAGHAWLIWRPTGGGEETYGTWGNRAPIGLHRNLEVGFPTAATRTTDLDATDYAALGTYATANNAWSLTNNCASFAARGWMSITGESVSYTSAFIPNPSALGAGIVALNGGATGGTLAVGVPGGTSSTPRSSTGTPSSASSSAGSSL